jgi:hypothetical protein
MGFLGFVNWRSVSIRFTVLMWMLAGVLAIVVLLHTGDPSPIAHHHAVAAARR